MADCSSGDLETALERERAQIRDLNERGGLVCHELHLNRVPCHSGQSRDGSTGKPMPEPIRRRGLQRATLQSPAAAGKAAQEALCRLLVRAFLYRT